MSIFSSELLFFSRNPLQSIACLRASFAKLTRFGVKISHLLELLLVELKINLSHLRFSLNPNIKQAFVLLTPNFSLGFQQMLVDLHEN